MGKGVWLISGVTNTVLVKHAGDFKDLNIPAFSYSDSRM